MSQLTNEERAELLDLIKKEWDLNPDWSFGYLIKQYVYQAVGHTELFDEDERKLLETFRAVNSIGGQNG